MQLVLLIPIQGADLPGFGGGLPAFGGGHPSTGPVYPPGHPSAGLPIQPGHPDAGLPPVHGRPTPPIALPPHVWPPSHIGSWQPRPSQPIQPPASGTKPVEPEQGLPAGSSLVLVYNAEKGWQGAVVDQSGTTKPIAPPTVEPK